MDQKMIRVGFLKDSWEGGKPTNCSFEYFFFFTKCSHVARKLLAHTRGLQNVLHNFAGREELLTQRGYWFQVFSPFHLLTSVSVSETKADWLRSLAKVWVSYRYFVKKKKMYRQKFVPFCLLLNFQSQRVWLLWTLVFLRHIKFLL